MTDFMQISDAQFNQIDDTIASTAQGRAFLREHARRNQVIGTEDIRKMIHGLRDSMESWSEDTENNSQNKEDMLRREFADISNVITKARQEIASLRPADAEDDKIVTATGELDAIVHSTERATADILNSAEHIEEAASKLSLPENADSIGNLQETIINEVTNIFMACSFQDITGQRTTKVINALRYIETRIEAITTIWEEMDKQMEGTPQKPYKRSVTANEFSELNNNIIESVGVIADDSDKRPDAHLLNGPASAGEEQDQSAIDALFDEAPTEPAPAPAAKPEEKAEEADPMAEAIAAEKAEKEAAAKEEKAEEPDPMAEAIAAEKAEKAEAEAKKKAEVEAKKKTEAEAKKKADAEAKKKTEAEAKKKAEDKAKAEKAETKKEEKAAAEEDVSDIAAAANEDGELDQGLIDQLFG